MTSKTSFYNRALFHKNITRFWPLWVLFTLALLLSYFLPFVTNGANAALGLDMGSTIDEITRYYVVFGMIFMLPYAVICAACCFSYLHKTRSAYMIHAFPLTRGILFRTNFLSGFLFAVVPWTLTSLLNLSVAIGFGSAWVTGILQSYVLVLLQFLFFYGLAVFCMHLTGKTSAGVLIYLVLNFIAPFLEALICALVAPFLYGYTPDGDLLIFLSPAANTLVLLGTSSGISWGYMVAIAAAGLVLTALAWLLYRRRGLEACGEVVAFRFAKPIFLFLMTLSCALCITLFVSLFAFDIESSANSLLFTLALLIVGSFIGFFAAQMLLKRSVRVFQARACGAFGIFAMLLTLSLLCVRFDVFGIISYVPQVNQVASVEVGLSTEAQVRLSITEKADIAELTKLHTRLIEERETIDNGKFKEFSFFLTYHLKTGKTIRRCYSFSDLDTTVEAQLYRQIDAFLHRGDLSYRYFKSKNLSDAEYIEISDKEHAETLNKGQAKAFCEALLQDAKEGKISPFDNMTSDMWVSIRINNRLFFLPISSKANRVREFIHSVLYESFSPQTGDTP